MCSFSSVAHASSGGQFSKVMFFEEENLSIFSFGIKISYQNLLYSLKFKEQKKRKPSVVAREGTEGGELFSRIVTV